MRITKLSLHSSSLPAIAAALLVAGLAPSQAHAQDSVAEEDPAAAPAEQIVVTGSRISVSAATESTSPITVIDAESIALSGQADLATQLRNIPALQGSLPGTDSVNQVAAGDSSDLGLSLLNLRQLGSVRTLVLEDGRRHVPGTGGSAAVDIGAIPQGRIKSVEVLTGGASSVYGADAVSGVVNFTLRSGRDFDGLEYNVQGGISDQGDAENYSVSLAGGGEFMDGRGSAVFSVDYSKQKSLKATDRDFAGTGLFGLGFANEAIFDLLGLTDADFGLPAGERPSQAFYPNVTLPVSSRFGIIAIDNGFASAFDAVNLINPNGSVPFLPGTNIPVAQVFDGTALRAFNSGTFVDAFSASGGDGIGANVNELILPELEQLVFSAGADFEITPGIEAFFEGKYAFTNGVDATGTPFNDDIPIRLDNPFIPAGLRAQVTQLQGLGQTPVIAVSRDIQDIDVLPQEETERSTLRFVAGLRGEFEKLGWKWELSYNYGRTEVESVFSNTRLDDRYFYAIDAIALNAGNLAGFRANNRTVSAIRGGQSIQINPGTAQAGDIICRSELDGTAPGVSPFPRPPRNPDGTGRAISFTPRTGVCAPINIFGPDAINGAGADFAFVDITNSTILTQQQILGSLAGDTAEFFELPGGAIGFAAGFEYRKDTSLFTPSPLQNSPGITSGVVSSGAPVNPSPDPRFQDPAIEVYEGFGEVRVPLLADMTFVDLLEFNGAIRFSDYNTIGKTTAWTVGGRYKPHETLAFRGTYSVAVRAPNLAELFGPVRSATIGLLADPCAAANVNSGSSFRPANCLEFVPAGFNPANFASAFRPGTTGGNPNLQEEEAETFTTGLVWQPTGMLSGLSLIVDYYDIKITGAVGSLTGVQIAAACVDLPSTDNQFCDAITRNPTTGVIDNFTAGNVNLGSLAVRGIDFAANYKFDVPFGADYGTIDLSLTGTHFLEDTQIFSATPGTPDPDPLVAEQDKISQAIDNDNLGEFGNPEWIANLGITWNMDAFTLGWTGRFESSQLSPGITNIQVVDVAIEGGKVVVKDDNTLVPLSQRDTGDSLVSDFFASYDFSEKFSLYGGINNAFDREPYLGSLVRPIGVRGRFFYLGVRGSF
ncbi:TonB-dependent receptor domain-containing protein [Erythrobacter sp. W302b]|uniref:TonB-dependent receptor domain-containing protein n=1 Tax=Erythrobacter sp. W302b TaxID=3389874 RepID=UPI00396B1607